MVIKIWGKPVMIATADEINEILAAAEEEDRKFGLEPQPEMLTGLAAEFDHEFEEVTIQ